MGAGRGIILAGEDSVRALCARLLKTAGIDCDEATDAVQADAFLSGPLQYDVLVLDPDLRGLGAASAIRLFRRRSPHGRVLVITDDPDALSFLNEDEVRSLTLLPKPFPIEAFLSAVQE